MEVVVLGVRCKLASETSKSFTPCSYTGSWKHLDLKIVGSYTHPQIYSHEIDLFELRAH